MKQNQFKVKENWVDDVNTGSSPGDTGRQSTFPLSCLLHSRVKIVQWYVISKLFIIIFLSELFLIFFIKIFQTYFLSKLFILIFLSKLFIIIFSSKFFIKRKNLLSIRHFIYEKDTCLVDHRRVEEVVVDHYLIIPVMLTVRIISLLIFSLHMCRCVR